MTARDGDGLSGIFPSGFEPGNNSETQKFCIPSRPVPPLAFNRRLKTRLDFERFLDITFRMFVPSAERLLVLNLE